MNDNDVQHDEQHALEDLVHSPGWQYVLAFIDAEWGNDGFSDKVEKVNGPNANEVQVRLAELCAARNALHALKQWPTHRLNTLRLQLEAPQPVLRDRGRM